MARRIERLGEGQDDLVAAAGHLFDEPPQPEWTRLFLGKPEHHLLVAYEDGEPAGFVTGVEMTHPDKGTEMFLYELGVDEAYRRRGIATDLVRALADLARERGCYGMWVLTGEDNEAARAAYTRAGGRDAEQQVLIAWTF